MAKKKATKPDRKEKKSKLGQFEKEATEKKKKADNNDDEDDYDGYSAEYYGDADVDWGPFGELMVFVFVAGGRSSWNEVHGTRAFHGPRELGEPLVPFFSVDLRYQSVAADIDAIGRRAELGYGPVAVQFDWTRYEEWDPHSRLDLTEWHLLYRMAGPKIEVDIGMGAMTIAGTNTRSAFSATLPLRVQPIKNMGISFRPVWAFFDGGIVSDYAAELSVGTRFLSINGGYRWVIAGGVTLGGPVLGLSFHL